MYVIDIISSTLLIVINNGRNFQKCTRFVLYTGAKSQTHAIKKKKTKHDKLIYFPFHSKSSEMKM